MKYLLVGINAKYIHSNLAINSLRAYASKYTNKDVIVREYTINMPSWEIVKGIYEEKPDFIGISVYLWNVNIVMQILDDIKALMPSVKIFLGGPEVSFEPEKLLKEKFMIDGIMLGEGEETFRELIEHYEKGQLDLCDIKGLCIRVDDGNVIRTNIRDAIDLSSVPFPYDNLSEFENRIIYYETSRGCPFGCAYCLSSIDKSVRFRNLELVFKEFRFFLDAKVPQVKLVDRTFNIDHKRSLKMLEFLKENDNGITNFHFEIAGDILTDEEIDMINSLRPGLVQLEIGVQTTNECTLDAINRRTNLEKLRCNVGKLLEGGKVHLHLDLIAGLPYEDLDSFKESFNNVYNMRSHELQLGFLKVLKGAPINAQVDSQEIKYSSSSPYEVLSTKYISYEDICELKEVEEMLEIYHNSCQFTESEKLLLQYADTPYDMYKKLADYYQEKKYPTMQCKRAIRYEIILEYAKDKCNFDDCLLKRLRRLLTMDYYSRENAKARPSFACDIEESKQIIKTITDNLIKENGMLPKNMIHVECGLEDGTYIAYDYSRRSPITGNADTIIIVPQRM